MPTGEWPTRADVELRLIDLGFVTIHVADDGMQTQVCAIGRSALTDSSVAEAISLMENEAGWKLLADPEPKAVLHDPPGQKASFYSYPRGGERLLRLSQPAWEITSVKTNAVYGDANSGHPMTLYQDVFPRGPDQDCATVLEFRQPVAGNALSVEVVAKWGRFAMLPDDLYEACLDLTTGLTIKRFREGLKANPVRWQEGDVSEAYGELMLKTAGDDLVETGMRIAKRYANPGVWF